MTWEHQLNDLAGGRSIEWSGSWNEGDLPDASASAVRRFEDQDREDRDKFRKRTNW